jgi:arginyl-tRNA synthetase
MKRYIRKLLSEVLGNMNSQGQIRAIPSFSIDVPKESFGDYTINVAHNIAREGAFQANDVAEIIGRELKALDYEKNIDEVSIVNGFVNIRIAKDKLAEHVNAEIQLDNIGDGKKVVFEYSSPNTNKALHIGHTRNDLFGIACINILRALGYDVVTTEIINDRGVHIMKSMLMYMKHGEGKTPESEGVKPDHFVGKFYAMFAEEVVKDPSLDEEAQELLRKWESNDSEVRALWKKMNTWFFEGVKVTYAREGATFDVVEFESDIYDKGRDLVLEGVKKGFFQKEEDGSVSVDLTEKGLDKKYLLRKDGTTLYITQDLYLWHLRNEKHHPDAAIVTTSAEQAYHFKVLSELFKKFGYAWAENFKHLPYEHVFLGKSKMSSRAGNTVSADDLFKHTVEKVQETMRNSQKIKASPDDLETVDKIASAAIKYGYLKYDRNTKIYFDLDETIAIEGNTGPYLQYTYARINSIVAKSEISSEDISKQKDLSLLIENSELSLMRHILHYGEIVAAASEDFRPNMITNYLYELSSRFNLFYDQVSVLGAENEELKLQRLALLLRVANVLEHGLSLLGIETVKEM